MTGIRREGIIPILRPSSQTFPRVAWKPPKNGFKTPDAKEVSVSLPEGKSPLPFLFAFEAPED